MAYKHSIPLVNNGVGTRTSKTRKYAACMVGTVTEASNQFRLNERKKIVEKLAEDKAKLAAMVAEHGITAEQAKEVHDARVKAHYAAPGTARDKNWEAMYEAIECKISQRAWEVQVGERNVASFDELPAVGTEFMISWHLSLKNAQTALGNRECQANRSFGYSLAIRTDFTVKG